MPTALAGPQVLLLAGFGLVAGLGLLVKGFGGYRRAARVEESGTSAIRSVAVGEARLSGIVEAAELTLVSPLQSVPCVYYRATVERSERDGARTLFKEERSIGFRLRDETGAIRVFPRGARWDVPARFAERGASPEEVLGLNLRDGPITQPAHPTRDEAIARLLTVDTGNAVPGGLGGSPSGGLAELVGMSATSYGEARVEFGDEITIVGMVLPFDQLPDPDAANEETGPAASDESADPVVAMDLAAGRASSAFIGNAEEAWGNAAIPGFGIGRPTREPTLDPDARRLPLASPEEAAAGRAYEIAPETLVVSATSSVSLLIVSGRPTEAAAREQRQFLVGLLGAILAIGSAIAIATIVTQFGLPTGLP